MQLKDINKTCINTNNVDFFNSKCLLLDRMQLKLNINGISYLMHYHNTEDLKVDYTNLITKIKDIDL